MSQKTYMYDTQWQALINAIDGGDTSAIATALGQIKTSVDGITSALGSLSTDVTQDSTQWTNLINAISSGGGGGGGTIDIDATQWSNLLTEIAKGDMTATATALNNIYTRLNSIGFNSTQWTNLVNAITNQSLTVDLSNITSSAVTNLSNVTGATVTDVINALNSTLTDTIIGSTTVTKNNKTVMIDFSITTTVAQLLGITLATSYRPADPVVIATIFKNTRENKHYIGYIYIGTNGKFSFYYIPTYAGDLEQITLGTIWSVVGSVTYIV